MFKRANNSLLINITCVMILLVILFYILIVWSALIIPFIIALLFSFAIIWLSNYYKKIHIRGFYIPSVLAFIFSIVTYVVIFWFIWKVIGSNIDELIRLLPIYQNRIIEIYYYTFDYLWLEEPESITWILQTINLQWALTSIISAFTSIASRTWLITFFVVFILLENRFFNKKLYLMIHNNSNSVEIIEIIEKIKKDVKSYFVVKTIVSVITAVLCYFIMLAYWLDFVAFWALLTFILNFIPNIGSIIAVFLPAMLSLVQPWFTITDSILMTSFLTIIQMWMWNFIEPQFMGNKLNLSPLVIITSLAFWWIVWWVVWMLLSVPIMVIINIILAKIPATRPIAILLSEKWDLKMESSEELIKSRKKILKSFRERLDIIDVIKKK